MNHTRWGMPVYELLQTSARSEDIDRLLALKKHFSVRRENMLALQKSLAKEKKYEAAKILKEFASDDLKHYRACCLFLGHLLCRPPGDSLYRPMKEWASELEDACRTVDFLVCNPPACERELNSELWKWIETNW